MLLRVMAGLVAVFLLVAGQLMYLHYRTEEWLNSGRVTPPPHGVYLAMSRVYHAILPSVFPDYDRDMITNHVTFYVQEDGKYKVWVVR